MDKAISIRNLSFAYKDKVVLEDLSLDINKGRWTTIIGLRGSGKTTLVDLIKGKYKSNNISMDMNTSICIINQDSFFEHEIVLDELKSYYRGKSLNKVIDDFKLEKIIEKRIKDLSTGLNILLQIIIKSSGKHKLIILDGCLDYLDSIMKNKIVKKINTKNNTIINITNNIDDCLIGDDIVIISDGKVVINDTKEKVFLDDKLIKSIGLGVPFIVDLSKKLEYYGLVNRIYFDMEELIDAIWK